MSCTNSWSWLKLMSIELVMPSNSLILYCLLLLPPSIFPASGSFPMSHLFASGSQNFGALASASVLPMNIQDWFPLGLTGLISLLSKGLSRVFTSTTVWKQQFFSAQPSLWSNSHISMVKAMLLTIWTFVGKLMSLLFIKLSTFVITFLLRSKHFLNFMTAVTICSGFGAQESKIFHCFHFTPSICHEVMDRMPWS